MLGIGKKKTTNNPIAGNQQSLYDNKQSLIDDGSVHNQIMQQAMEEDKQTKFLQSQQQQQQVEKQFQPQTTIQNYQQNPQQATIEQSPTTKEYEGVSNFSIYR